MGILHSFLILFRVLLELYAYFTKKGDESNIIDIDVCSQDAIDLSIKIDELAFHEIKLNPVEWDEGMKYIHKQVKRGFCIKVDFYIKGPYNYLFFVNLVREKIEENEQYKAQKNASLKAKV